MWAVAQSYSLNAEITHHSQRHAIAPACKQECLNILLNVGIMQQKNKQACGHAPGSPVSGPRILLGYVCQRALLGTNVAGWSRTSGEGKQHHAYELSNKRVNELGFSKLAGWCLQKTWHLCLCLQPGSNRHGDHQIAKSA